MSDHLVMAAKIIKKHTGYAVVQDDMDSWDDAPDLPTAEALVEELQSRAQDISNGFIEDVRGSAASGLLPLYDRIQIQERGYTL